MNCSGKCLEFLALLTPEALAKVVLAPRYRPRGLSRGLVGILLGILFRCSLRSWTVYEHASFG